MRLSGWLVAGTAVVTTALVGTVLGVLTSDTSTRAGDPDPVRSPPSATATPPPEGAQPPDLPDVPRNLRRDLPAPPGAYGSDRGRSVWSLAIHDARWNPCEPLRFVLNTADAPAGAVDDFRAAVYKVDQATDLVLDIDDTTTDVVDPAWADVPGRPVLVSWGTGTHGVLEPGSAATAEPVAWLNYDGEKVYAAGQVTFNTRADWQYIPGTFGLPGSRVALYMHEVAHIIGLGHVRDPRQLMHNDTFAATDLSAGDLAGLEELTSGPCLTPPDPEKGSSPEPAG